MVSKLGWLPGSAHAPLRSPALSCSFKPYRFPDAYKQEPCLNIIYVVDAVNKILLVKNL